MSDSCQEGLLVLEEMVNPTLCQVTPQNMRKRHQGPSHPFLPITLAVSKGLLLDWVRVTKRI